MKTMMAIAGMTLAVAGSAWAQQPAERPAEALHYLLGEWDGTGWATGPDGQRSEFRVHEIITSRAGGHAVSMQGAGYAPSGESQRERQIHDAFALMWADRDGSYHIRSVVMQGHTVETEIELGENRFQWEVDAGPMGEMRYTTTVEDGVWRETGERRVGDGDWTVFLEMTLERAE